MWGQSLAFACSSGRLARPCFPVKQTFELTICGSKNWGLVAFEDQRSRQISTKRQTSSSSSSSLLLLMTTMMIITINNDNNNNIIIIIIDNNIIIYHYHHHYQQQHHHHHHHLSYFVSSPSVYEVGDQSSPTQQDVTACGQYIQFSGEHNLG